MAYIDRDLLLKDIEESVVFTVSKGQRNSPEIRGANKVIDRVKQMPTADVVEVKHGQWEKVFVDGTTIIEEEYGELYKCSLCGNTGIYSEYDKFCSHCGAKMDFEAGVDE